MLAGMTTDQKGAIAEACIAAAAVKLGIEVYRPIAEGGRYDMIFDLETRLLRVQCKWASRRGEVLVVSCQSARRCAEGFIRRPYTAAEVDAIPRTAWNSIDVSSSLSIWSSIDPRSHCASPRAETISGGGSTGLTTSISPLDLNSTKGP